ncbi:MAG: DUF935 family protein [Acidobacteriota bacterium]
MDFAFVGWGAGRFLVSALDAARVIVLAMLAASQVRPAHQVRRPRRRRRPSQLRAATASDRPVARPIQARVERRGARLRDEMAGRAQTEAGYRWGLATEDEHPSEILRTRSRPGDRLGELWSRVLTKDTACQGLFRKLFDHVLALDHTIAPPVDTPLGRAAADLCRRALDAIPDLEINLGHQLWAMYSGIAFDETMWHSPSRGPLASRWVPRDIVDRPMHRFAIVDGELRVRQALEQLVAPPPHKFIVSRVGSKDLGWPVGLADTLYWPAFLKLQGRAAWALLVDRWSDPMATVTYPVGKGRDASSYTQQQQELALDVLHQLAGDSTGAAIPEGLALSLLESARSGSASYQEFMVHFTREQALTILGEIQTSGLKSAHGSYASDQVMYSLLLARVKLCARGLSRTIESQLLAPIVAMNLGRAAPVPRYRIAITDAEDRQMQMQALSLARDLRLADVPVAHIRSALAIPTASPAEAVFEWPEPADPFASPTPRFAAASAETSTPRVARLHLVDDRVEREIDATSDRRMDQVDGVGAAFRSRLDLRLATIEGELDSLYAMSAFSPGGDGWLRAADLLAGDDGATPVEGALIHATGLAFAELSTDGVPLLPSAAPAAEGPIDLPLQGYRRLELADTPPPPSVITPADALEYWLDRLPLIREQFLGLGDDLRRLAQTIALGETIEQVRRVSDLVAQAVRESWPRERFREALNGVLRTSRAHADLVLTNTSRQAHAAVRHQHTVGNPAADRVTPYIRWTGRGDDRMRDEHAAMHRKVFARSHPIWRVWWYPAGHKCRCYAAVILAATARRLGLVGDEPTGPWPMFEGRRVMPDDGFRAAPSVATLQQAEETRVRKAGADAAASAPADASGSLRALLERILGSL